MLPGMQKVSSVYLLLPLSSSRVDLTKYLEIILPVTFSPFSEAASRRSTNWMISKQWFGGALNHPINLSCSPGR
jgi:hypothetical protein